MKKASLIAATLLLGAGAGISDVEAQATGALVGSDTLEEVTDLVLAATPGAAGLTYLGGGSGGGETALAQNFTGRSDTNFQQIAPMSRRIKCSNFAGGAVPTADGVVLGYDGIVLVRSATTYVNGDTQAYSVTSSAGLPGGYVWSGGTDAALPLGPNYPVAADKLRVLYFGRDHTNTTDCNSALRNALVNSWNNLFEGDQSAETCTRLNHAYRRCDPSGTTDTFRTLLGIPSAVPFCNGSDNQDNDPIRRPCDAASEVCGGSPTTQSPSPFGNMGLVQPICAEAFADGGDTYTSLPQNTASDFCSIGKFAYKPVVLPTLPGQKCPDGTAIIANSCKAPYKTDASAPNGQNFKCYAKLSTQPTPHATGMDGRVFNLVARNVDGSLRKNARKAGQNTSVGQAAYRGFPSCKKQDATAQIGCMIVADGGCSEGFAGLQVLDEPNTRAVKLASKQSTNTTPEATAALTPEDNSVVIQGAKDPNLGYILGRKLYVNTFVGVANVGVGALATASQLGPQQKNLLTAFQTRSVVDPIILSKNFINVPLSESTTAGLLPIEAQNASLCAP